MPNKGKKVFERRFMPGSELRADGTTGKISGYAAVYNRDSTDMGGFIEVIRPGAFSKTVRENKEIKALHNHNTDKVLGALASGTLTVRDDSIGVFVEIDPPEWAGGIVESISRGDTPGSSFQFRAIQDKWTARENEPDYRELIEVEAREFSVGVAYPAYPDASQITARSLEALSEIGIDAALLTDVVTRSRVKGYTPTDGDIEAMNATLRALRGVCEPIHADEPGTEPPHSSGQQSRSSDAELENKISGLTESLKSFEPLCRDERGNHAYSQGAPR